VNFSYWEHKHLLADIDYLVVGLGLVGLQAAIRLKEINKSAKVAIVDRFAWSLGASTRNAGFACFANISEIIDDLQRETPDNVYGTVVDTRKTAVVRFLQKKIRMPCSKELTACKVLIPYSTRS
jgi:flavin-dependent dehydrogenase